MTVAKSLMVSPTTLSQKNATRWGNRVKNVRAERMGQPPDARQRELFGESLRRAFWQARFYDFNVWTEKKRVEKLRYMHRNPVRRALVELPEQWRWSSYRHYFFGEAGLVQVNAGWGEISFRDRVA